jgi:hypothetical protein
VLASVSSLMSVLHRLGTDEPSIPRIAEEWIDYLVVGNERSMAARRDGSVPAGRAIDLTFVDLVADTFGAIGGLYDRMGRDLTAETEAAMRAFLADNPSDKHGTHTYSFADTGLDVAACRARVADYDAFFGVPTEVT